MCEERSKHRQVSSAYRILIGEIERRNLFGEFGVDGSIILKWT
jgi:hypothetical protein